MRLVGVVMAWTFVIANTVAAIAIPWLIVALATSSAAFAGPFAYPITGALLYYAVLPAVALEAVLYLLVFFMARIPILQAHGGMMHGIKYLAMANSAGPFDTGYGGFGRRRCDQPHLAGLPHARDVRLRTRDGQALGAWHVLPSGTVALEAAREIAAGGSTSSADAVFDKCLRRAASDRERGTCDAASSGAVAAIYLHGMGETRTKWVCTEHAKYICAQLQLHLVVLDYRGFADSTGLPLHRDAGFTQDTDAALSWLEDRGVHPSEVVVWGHSLGTGPAIALAHAVQARSPPTPLCALVLEAPYTSLCDACRTFPIGHVIRSLPFGDEIMCRYFAFDLPSLQMLPCITAPTLVLHGTADILVPFQHTVELAQAVAAEGRSDSSFTFVPLLGCGHLHALFHHQTLSALANFFGALRPASGTSSGGAEHA